MAQIVSKCIFCERTERIHREHLFPTWLRRMLPRSHKDTHIRAKVQSSKANPRISGIHSTEKYNGNVSSVSLRVVCQQRCNGGWMSALEMRAKPILMPLVSGQAAVLSREHQRVLAAWAAMKIMIAEFSDPDDLYSTQAERRYLMDWTRPPEGWTIWIAQHQSRKWTAALDRQYASLWAGETLPDNPLVAKNVQMATLGLGRLLIQTLAHRIQGLDFEAQADMRRITKQIWPDSGGGFLWPCLPVLNERGADMLAANLTRSLNSPAFRWKGQ